MNVCYRLVRDLRVYPNLLRRKLIVNIIINDYKGTQLIDFKLFE